MGHDHHGGRRGPKEPVAVFRRRELPQDPPVQLSDRVLPRRDVRVCSGVEERADGGGLFHGIELARARRTWMFGGRRLNQQNSVCSILIGSFVGLLSLAHSLWRLLTPYFLTHVFTLGKTKKLVEGDAL